MAPIDDETLDRLLAGHLSARLDGQLGRAEPAFRRRLTEADLAVAAGAATAANDVAPLRLVPADADADAVPNDRPADADVAAPLPLRPAARPRPWLNTGGWVWGAVGTALAAAVAAVFVLPQANVNPGGGSGVNQVATTQGTKPDVGTAPRHVVSPPTVRYIRNQTWDEGTYAPADSAAPVRRLRHQQVEHIRVYDERRGAWIELTVPREDVELFELDTY